MAGFPQAFTEMLSAAYGAEIAADVLAALSEPPSVSVRLNPFRHPDPVGNEAFFSPECPGEMDLWEMRRSFTSIPWSPHGCLLSKRRNFTLDPLFHAGCYYVQDSSAMFAGELLRLCLDGKAGGTELGPGVRMLDLCAAPGGKTTDAATSLRERFGDRFTLLSNEVMRKRFSVLRSNVRTWGDPRVGVVSRDPAEFGKAGPMFDILLADVPCSGEGMFRKDPRALAEWSPETVAFCAARQRRILSDVWPALRPGGILIYATCTFNHTENDDNIRWIASELGAHILEPDARRRPHRRMVQDEDLIIPLGGPDVFRTPAGGFAFLPGFTPGEGQYIALLQKEGDAPAAGGDPFREFRAEIPAASDAADSSLPRYGLDLQTALRYLHGDAIRLSEDAPKGLLTLTYRGVPLGPAKNIGSRCNNLYPKDRRIRMDIPLTDPDL